jgi:hypothetical protein
MYEVTQKLQFYTFFYPLNVLIPSSCSQQCNGLTIFWLAEKTRLKTPIKRSKIKLLYLLAPSLFLLNRAHCSACADKFPTCSTVGYYNICDACTPRAETIWRSWAVVCNFVQKIINLTKDFQEIWSKLYMLKYYKEKTSKTQV